MFEDFLFEIGSEEIPAHFQVSAKKQLWDQVEQFPGIAFDCGEVFVTPRRLALLLQKVRWVSPPAMEKKGPLVAAGQEAFQGFCNSLSVPPEACLQRETPRGPAWVARITSQEVPIETVLIAFCTHVLNHFSWPKSMKWNQEGASWIRPIRRLLAFLGSKPLLFSWRGMVSGTHSEGHRLGCKEFLVECPAQYEARSREAFVMLRSQERMERIREILDSLAHEVGCVPKKIDGMAEDSIIGENAGLTQWPTGVLGTFDPVFLTLPEEVIATALSVHQRCFCLQKATTGKMAPFFVMITDGLIAADSVRRGVERVVRARLSDALFFFQQDCRSPLSSYTPLLKTRSFFQGLGSVYEKVERLQQSIAFLARLSGQEEKEGVMAASLSQSDLATAMVGEFPTLQGIMGRVYGLQEGIQPKIAQALQDSYVFAKPCLQETSALGALLAVADGVDTLVGFFALGRAPSGSKDPMALRRTCYRVIRACLAHGLSFSIPLFLDVTLSGFQKQGYLKKSGYGSLWPDFFRERLCTLLPQEYGIACARAGFMGEDLDDNLWVLFQRIQFLSQHVARQKDFLQACHRVSSLLKGVREEEVDRNVVFHTPYEQALQSLLSLPLSSFSPLAWASAIHHFLDHVRVKEPPYQRARMGLLMQIMDYFRPLGHWDVLWEEASWMHP